MYVHHENMKLTMKMLQDFLEISADRAYDLDNNNRVLFYYASKKLADSTPGDAILGKCILDFLPPDGVPKVTELLKSLEKQEIPSGRVTYIREDGSHLEFSAIAKLEKGMYMGCRVLIKNLSQRLSPRLTHGDSSYAEFIQDSSSLNTEKELQVQLKQQELLIRVSVGFTSSETFHDSVNQSLKLLGEFMQVDRVYIFKDYSSEQVFSCEYEWTSGNTKPMLPYTQKVPYNNQHDSYLQLLTLPFVAINNTAILPSTEHQKPKDLGIKAFINVPIFVNGNFWGFMGIDSCVSSRIWTKSETNFLSIFVGILSSEINRESIQRALLKAMEQTKQASKAKSEFLSRMSHEIRTPMNTILGMTTIALKSPDMEKIADCLKKIETASQQLLGIINDILDISKIEAGKFEINQNEFQMESLLESVKNVISPQSFVKNQLLTFNVDFDFTRKIISDETRLMQVMVNLLSNAVKFTPENGSITVDISFKKIDPARAKLLVSIKDTGIGLSDEEASRLFQPFEQADGSITRRFGGTGLGLAICKTIVQMMGGSIGVKSSPGRGSDFYFDVPFQWGNPVLIDQESCKKNHDVKKNQWKGKKILLAEDMEINREILINLLEDTGVSIDSAENGIRALEMFSLNPGMYDIILMDIQMPGMDGLTCCRSIRSMETSYGKNIPIIAMTAHAFKQDVIESLNAGMNAHISKPIDYKELISVLSGYLDCTS